MANLGSIFSKLTSLIFILLLHLSCFPTFTSSKTNLNPKKVKKPHKLPPLSHLKKHPKQAISASISFLKRLLPSSRTTTDPAPPEPLANNIITASLPDNDDEEVSSRVERVISSPSSPSLFPLRNDIFPCTSCGEIFQAAHSLDHHRTAAHAVTELHGGDPGRNVVHMIFQAGWSPSDRAPLVQRVLKIHNSQKILSRFEEYREFVKFKAASSKKTGSGAVSARRDDERCKADGNELLRFFCSTFVCNLGANGRSSLCSCNYCSICGVIRSGFSPKLDGIPVYSTSHRAHLSIPGDVEKDFEFMHVKRAVMVCRVIAGRVGSDDDVAASEEKEGGGFDSVVVGGLGPHTRLDEEELVVFNPRAVLPCFIIVYTV